MPTAPTLVGDSIEELTILHLQGLSWQQISKATGIPSRTIAHRVRFQQPRSGAHQSMFEAEVYRQREEGRTYLEIADDVGCPQSTARAVVARVAPRVETNRRAAAIKRAENLTEGNRRAALKGMALRRTE